MTYYCLFTQDEDTDCTGDEVTEVGLMNVGEDVVPGIDDCSIALVAGNLQTQKVLGLYGQDGEGGPGGEAIQHGGRKVNGDEA